jgi:hypothetical protein
MDYFYVDYWPRAQHRVRFEGQEHGVELDWFPQAGEIVTLPEDVYLLRIPAQDTLLVDWRAQLLYGNGVTLRKHGGRPDWAWRPVWWLEEIAAQGTISYDFIPWASGYLRLRWEWAADPGDANVTWSLYELESATPSTFPVYYQADLDPLRGSGQWETQATDSDEWQRRPYVTAGVRTRLSVTSAAVEAVRLSLDVGIQAVQRGD